MSDFKAQFITYFSIEHDNFSILNLYLSNKKGTLDQLVFSVYEKWKYKVFSLNFGMISIYPI